MTAFMHASRPIFRYPDSARGKYRCFRYEDTSGAIQTAPNLRIKTLGELGDKCDMQQAFSSLLFPHVFDI